MNTKILESITKSPLRHSLYHFTRARNLPAIAGLDGLYASARLDPDYAQGIRRETLHQTQVQGRDVWMNAHLRIVPEAMAPGTTPEEFRACLDRHIFLWPTVRDCLAMYNMYSRREPGETFAVLKFSAYDLLQDNFGRIRLSKYDSGSSPRFPHRMSYRKSCEMLLPLRQFMLAAGPAVPCKPSKIKEVLVEDQLTPVSRYLQTVYCSDPGQVPDVWKPLVKQTFPE